MRLLKEVAGKVAGLERSGAFRPGLLAWHWGLAAWLLAATRIFTTQPVGSWLALGISAGLMAGACWVGGLHRDPRGGSPAGLVRLIAGVVLVALLHVGAAGIGRGNHDLLPALWFGGMFVLLAAGSRRVIAQLAAGEFSLEALRWLLLGGLVVGLDATLYSVRPLGGGDAYWYRIMLADFVEQVRSTGLPVWAGQTEYAFNGAVIPLRMAPWFQHAGALLDLLTARTLHYVALTNLVLALNALAAAFSAYFCFRALAPRQPWSAVLVAFLYLASPALLAPLTNSDQYMTFMATPILPVAGYALWRIFSRDHAWDYFLLAAALAALWQTHPPIALCLCFFSATGGIARLLLRRGFRWSYAALALAVFLLLGSLPFASVYSLHLTKVDLPLSGGGVDYDLATVFAPITRTFQFNQPGFSALLLGVFGLGVFFWRRTVAAGIVLFLIGLLIALVLPIPGLNVFLWNQVPRAAMQVLNLWPMQRLAGIWVMLMLVVGMGSLDLLGGAGRRTWLTAACFWLLLVPGAVWTAWQARYLVAHWRETSPQGRWQFSYEKHNLVLSRYAFNPFPIVPGYFSHGYIDPVLEHRLLHPDLTPILSNADSAVRRGPVPAPDPDGTARLAAGTWRAVNDHGSTFYNLQPALALPAQQHLALRLEPLDPGQPGWLQLRGDDLFREYILPDSGVGGANRPAPRGFGTLPSSSRVVSLFTRQPLEAMQAINIAPERKPAATDFDFARYELWRYDPAELPIVVMSWAPYHLIVHSPEAGYLETPRAWLPNYRAKINGQRVYGLRSPEGLVMFAVPAGRSDIAIKYVPPLWLELTYWLNLTGWLALLAAALRWLLSTPPLSGSLPAAR
ncbi:MAG TPA: hypothetical protein VF388_06110 [Lacunisphaera sp.]